VDNKKALAKAGEMGIFKHIALLVFSFVASFIFNSMGFITATQIPLCMPIAFISVEWVCLQHKNEQIN